MIARILAVLSIPLVAVGLWLVIRQVRRPSPLRRWTPVIGLVMAPLGMLLNVVILRQAAPGRAGWLAGIVGVLFGIAWDRTTRIEVADGGLIARRSVLYLVLWGIAYAITQILVSVTVAGWVSAGLLSMCFATGTAIGMNVDLLTRYRRARSLVSQSTTGS